MCKTELRITKDHRDDASLYHMGLLKVAGTWPAEVSPQRAREPTNFAPAIEEAEVVAVEAVPVAVAAQSSSGTQPTGGRDGGRGDRLIGAREREGRRIVCPYVVCVAGRKAAVVHEAK